MSDCLFCKIRDKVIPATVVFEDATVMAIRDISPKAPVHVLVIPKAHIKSLAEMELSDEALIGHMHFIARRVAEEEGISGGGYRTVFNTGEHGGQAVPHLHLHVLGGRPMSWPPG